MTIHFKASLFVFCLLVSSLTVQAQGEYPITDRSFAYATAFTMPTKTFMVEGGVFQLNDLNGLDETSLSGSQLLLRYGLASLTEIRLKTGHQRFTFDPSFGMSNEGGIVPLELSIKRGIVAEGQYTPAVYILGELLLPIGDQFLKPEKVRPSLRLIVEKYLNRIFIIGSNIGYRWQDFDQKSLTYSISLRTALAEKWSLYTEFYGFNSNQVSSNNFADFALEYWVAKDLVLDLVYGGGISDFSDGNFWSIGVALRFD